MQQFISQVTTRFNKSSIITDPLQRYAYATDASLYQLIPQVVIIVDNISEVQQLLVLANQFKVALTFRSAGTSLSGQAVTEQVLVVLANYSWQKHKIHNQGTYISLEPGIIGSDANAILSPYNKKIGPDPASINACKIGGIAANNSSGMCCGILNNTYHTMVSMKLLLANGSYLDSADYDSRNQFIHKNISIINGIRHIYEQIHTNENLVNFIRDKFAIKNTSGYSLNAFIDYEDPLDILTHLMVGSEGTLGFIGEVTYKCIPHNRYKAVSMIFGDLQQLIHLVLALETSMVEAIELMDTTSLNAIKNLNNKSAKYLPSLKANTSAILIEISQETTSSLNAKKIQVQQIIDKYTILHQIAFTSDRQTYEELWDIRKGIYPIIGSNRPSASTVIIEDIAVAINDLPEAVSQLQQLFIQYNYTNAAIFGHVLSGNIHFVFTPNFSYQTEIDNYDSFMHNLTQIIATKFRGSLKAEHGCGRNIAPFVRLEWGEDAYAVMWQIKNLLDPNHILNPDVILTNNPLIHLYNLKQLEPTNPIIDKCVECGFCEKVCPSRNLNITPRQRISVYRYLTKLSTTQPKLYSKLAKKYKSLAIDTCATTGLCSLSCPVNIDTGRFILELRSKPKSMINQFWTKHFNILIYLTHRLINGINFISRIVGKEKIQNISKSVHKYVPVVPIYPVTMPNVQTSKFYTISNNKKHKITYIPSCNNRIFADELSCDNSKDSNAIEKLLRVLDYEIIYPPNLQNLCCGQLFSSKGEFDVANSMLRTIEKMVTNSKYPVLIDNSSCYFSLSMISNVSRESGLISIVDLIHSTRNKLNLKPKYNKVAIHVDCSSEKLKHRQKIIDICRHCAHEIILPSNIYCCGFAGTKGFTLPKLNQSALITLADQIDDCDLGVTCNRNCQIGLSLHGKKQYISIAELVLSCINIV